MKLRPLGRSGLKVSPLALGTMNFGSDWHGVGGVDEKTASGLVDLAMEHGVNLIDTADVYGRGASETLLGRVLKGRRNKVLIATKVCGEMKAGDPSTGGLSARHIKAALDASLRRLKTDHVDLYMAHAPDAAVPLWETLEAFDRAVKAGKARVVGCSNFSGVELTQALLLKRDGQARWEFTQDQYSLADRYVEKDLGPLLEREEMGLLAWSPLGGGFLTGKYRAGKRLAGRRKDPAAAFPPLPEAKLAGLIDVLAKVAALEGLTCPQAALGWLLSKGRLTSAVIGARDATQLRENLAARPLAEKSVSLLDRASTACLGADAVGAGS